MQLSLVLDSVWVFCTRVLMRVSNFLVLAILARALPLDAFGLYAFAVATLLMLSFMMDFGIRQAAANQIGKIDDPTELSTHLAALTATTCVLTAIVSFAIMAWPGDSGNTLVAALFALTAIPVMVLRCLQGVQLGTGRLDQLNISESLPRMAMLVGIALLWPFNAINLVTVFSLMLGAHFVGAGYLFWVLCVRFLLRVPLDFRVLWSLLLLGAVFVTGAIAMIALGRISIWIISSLMSLDDVAVYFAALRLSELPVEVAGAIGVALFSYGVRGQVAASSAQDTAIVIRATTFLLFVGTIFLGGVADLVLELAFGSAFADHAALLRIMLIGAVFSCVNMMLYPCLASNGHARIGILAYGPGVFVAALLTWLLIPIWGLEGAAWSVVLAKLWVMSVLSVAFCRHFEIHPTVLLIPRAADFLPIVRRARTLIGRSSREEKSKPKTEGLPLQPGAHNAQ